jgi:DNA polymerase III delta prime subunit
MEHDTLFVNKYKPVFFNDFYIDDNDDTINTLKTFIHMDNLNILLIGDVASGKTSLLNTIITEYYSAKDYKDHVLFINSLKEQGINYYRNDVKTFCQTCSNMPLKKKIIVLDDLDLINEQSQQVFRNYLDKYSHNVCFIASCSNKQKIIESLQSRLTIVKINSMQKSILTSLFKKIKKEENIEMDSLVEDFIINVSNNSVKTLINYMEKFKLYGKQITFEMANKLCTNISFMVLEEYTNLVKNGNLIESVKIIYNIFDEGYSVMDILDNYFLFIKNTLILTENQKYEIISVICKYIAVFHNIHEDEIELALFTNNIIHCLHCDETIN